MRGLGMVVIVYPRAAGWVGARVRDFVPHSHGRLRGICSPVAWRALGYFLEWCCIFLFAFYNSRSAYSVRPALSSAAAVSRVVVVPLRCTATQEGALLVLKELF